MTLPRAVLGLLVVANLVYLLWTLGALSVFGAEPRRMREAEPQRLAQQLRPGALRVRSTGDARPAPSPAPAAAPGAAPAAAPAAAAASTAALPAPDEPPLTQQFDHR